MLDESVDVSRTLFDTYLIYLIIGLILFVALIGLLVLLSTSCCCFYCFFYSASTCLCCCYHHRRQYSLNRVGKQQAEPIKGRTIRRALRRRASDLTDFSQLYDSCPHLINSKAMLSNSKSFFSFLCRRLFPSRRLDLRSCPIHDTSRLSPCPNIYETVPPIYESEWRHPVGVSTTETPLSVVNLPQRHPYDRVLSSRLNTSDSIRRTTILTRLKDDAAFLY